MLYALLYPLHEQISLFNIFRYITFRAIAAAITAFCIMLVCMPPFIAWLRRRQIGQVIRSDGPESHFSKKGVPTMGGVLILAALTSATLLWADLRVAVVWVTMGLTLAYGAIGAADDLRKVLRDSSRGLTARQKLVLQVCCAGLVGLFIHVNPVYDGTLSVPFFKNFHPDLGWGYIPFAILVIVGASNAVNLTDGLDGLASGPVVITGAVYLIFAYIASHAVVAGYLQVPHVLGAGEVAVFCGGLVGASLGFLWFNCFPAQVFMGDAGSLALGGALGTVAVIIKQESLLVVAGGIFVAEALSVMMQVGYFKLTGGKRIFLMAPFHHHFEKKGWKEPQVVVRFWIISIILGLLAMATLKVR